MSNIHQKCLVAALINLNFPIACWLKMSTGTLEKFTEMEGSHMQCGLLKWLSRKILVYRGLCAINMMLLILWESHIWSLTRVTWIRSFWEEHRLALLMMIYL